MPKQKTIVALYDYSGSTDEELDFSEGDVFILINDENSDWWYVADPDDESRVGYVPRTYVAVADKEGRPIKDKADEKPVKLHDHIMRASSVDARARRSTLNKKGKEVIMGADGEIELPPGCSESVLSSFKKNENKILSKTLCPVVNSAGSGFDNLTMDPYTKRLKSVPVQCTLGFSLIEAKYIDTLVGDKRVLGRHIRMSLFDNSNVLSNVHSIPAVSVADVPNAWRFSTKASLLFPKDDENTCFLRTNDIDIKLCILFELCALLDMSERRNKADIIEVSVGWGMLPLFTSDGTAIENKSYDIRLYSGSPFSKEAFAKEFTEKKGFFQTLLQGNKYPRLQLKVWKLGKSVMDEINQLPESICSFLSAVPVMAKYRQIMSDSLLRDRNYGPHLDAALAVFPAICDQSDLLRLLVLIWERKTKHISKNNAKKQKVNELLQKKFRECVLLLWPMLHMHDLPVYIEGHEKMGMNRVSFANGIQELGMLELLGKNREQYGIAPFDMSELACNFP